ECDGGMFARRAAAEVLAAEDDLVGGDELVIGVKGHVSLGQPPLRRRDAAQGVLTELPVFLGDGRVQRQVLRRDDLVGVDVVAEDERFAGDGGLHGRIPHGLRTRTAYTDRHGKTEERVERRERRQKSILLALPSALSSLFSGRENPCTQSVYG